MAAAFDRLPDPERDRSIPGTGHRLSRRAVAGAGDSGQMVYPQVTEIVRAGGRYPEAPAYAAASPRQVSRPWPRLELVPSVRARPASHAHSRPEREAA